LVAKVVDNNPWTEDKLIRPIEWPLRVVAVVLAIISGTEIYSEIQLPHPKWLLMLFALVFGFWFGYLGITGRKPDEVIKKLKHTNFIYTPTRRKPRTPVKGLPREE